MTERWITDEDEPLLIVDSKGEYESISVLYREDTQTVRDLLNDYDEKYIDEFSLRETVQLELQRVEEENEQLKHDATVLICSNQEYRKENEELKSIKNFAERKGINIFKIDEAFRKCWADNSKLTEENNELRGLIDLIADINLTIPRTNVKDLIQDEITSIETVIDDSGEAWNTYCILDNFFKEHYKKKKMG